MKKSHERYKLIKFYSAVNYYYYTYRYKNENADSEFYNIIY